MANEWVDVFGGDTVKASHASYQVYTTLNNGALQLEWAVESSGEYSTGDFMRFVFDEEATIYLPDARIASTGVIGIVYNDGSEDVTFLDFLQSGEILILPPGSAYMLVLTDNGSEGGAWMSFPVGAGSSVAHAASLASANIIAQGGILSQSLPVTSLSTNYTLGSSDRAQLFKWTGGVGTFTLTDSDNLDNGWFVHVKNAGSGVLTLAAPAGETIDGDTQILFNPGESAIVACEDGSFVSISRAVSSSSGSDFSFLSIAVAGTGNYTLSTGEQGYTAYRFTGILTGTRTIIVPSVLAPYWVQNATTGGFTFTVKTAAGTGVNIATGESKIVYCNGTDVVDAATAGISVPVTISQGGTGATTAAAARTNLGATSVGGSLFTTASSTAARSTLGISSVGDSLFTAANAAAARTAIGATTIGSNIFTALDAAAVKTLLDTGFPSGTLMLFQQTSAPTGWTKQTANNDKALRVVSGSVSTGGTVAFSQAFKIQSVTGAVGDTTLTINQIPGHTHVIQSWGALGFDGTGGSRAVTADNNGGNVADIATGSAGGGLPHNHPFTGTDINLNVAYVDLIIAQKA